MLREREERAREEARGKSKYRKGAEAQRHEERE